MAFPRLQMRSVASAGIKSQGCASSYNPFIIPIDFQGSQLPAGTQLCLSDSFVLAGRTAERVLPYPGLSPGRFYHPKSLTSGPEAGGCGTQQPACLTGADLVISQGQSPGRPASAQAG